MGHPHYTKEEIAARGQAIYEQRIRPQVEPARNGQYLVINVETAEYEIDADEAHAGLQVERAGEVALGTLAEHLEFLGAAFELGREHALAVNGHEKIDV